MKKICCNIHMFDLNQHINIIDTDTGENICVAVATMEELPEVISAISNERNITNVVLSGNSIFSAAVSEDIIAYSKMHYCWNNIKVEVVK